MHPSLGLVTWLLLLLLPVCSGFGFWLYRRLRICRANPHQELQQQASAPPAGFPYSYEGYVVVSYKRGSHQHNGNSNEGAWLYDKLKPEPGCTPFQDIQNLIKGELFKPQLSAACQTCSVFVPLLSKSYVKSRFCLQELRWASEADPQPALVPVLFDDPAVLQQQCLPAYRRVLNAALKLECVVVPPSGFGPDCANKVVAAVRAHLRPVLQADEGIAEAAEWCSQVTAQLEANRMVVLHGPCGSGKSILAKLTYQQLLARKELGGRVCLVKVGKDCSENQLCQLQQQMLVALKKLTVAPVISSSIIGATLLADAVTHLAEKPFAVILDDVRCPYECEMLLPPRLRNSSSCWGLVTTREMTVLPQAVAMKQPVLSPAAEWEVLQYNAGRTLDALSPADRKLLLDKGEHLPLKLWLLGREFSISPPGSKGADAVLQHLRHPDNWKRWEALSWEQQEALFPVMSLEVTRPPRLPPYL